MEKEGNERIQQWTNYNSATKNYTVDGLTAENLIGADLPEPLKFVKICHLNCCT